MHGETLKFLN